MLRHEEIPETHVMATILTGNICLFISFISDTNKLFQMCVAQFTLDMCDAQVFKIKNSEISC